jgi:hypothetical protein
VLGTAENSRFHDSPGSLPAENESRLSAVTPHDRSFYLKVTYNNGFDLSVFSTFGKHFMKTTIVFNCSGAGRASCRICWVPFAASFLATWACRDERLRVATVTQVLLGRNLVRRFLLERRAGTPLRVKCNSNAVECDDVQEVRATDIV